jgi:hypothetical protein
LVIGKGSETESFDIVRNDNERITSEISNQRTVYRFSRSESSAQLDVLPSTIKIEKSLRFENAGTSMNVRLWGTTIESNEDRENASESIRLNCAFDSNEIDESDSQPQNHCEPRVSPTERTKFDCNEDRRVASDSIRFNCEFDSNEINESN